MDITNSDLTKETMDFAENIEFSENILPKTEIKEEKGFKIENQKVFLESQPFDVKPDLNQLKNNIDFVETIEFSENILHKKEIKVEEEFDQEVWKPSLSDVKPKLSLSK